MSLEETHPDNYAKIYNSDGVVHQIDATNENNEYYRGWSLETMFETSKEISRQHHTKRCFLEFYVVGAEDVTHTIYSFYNNKLEKIELGLKDNYDSLWGLVSNAML